MKKIIVILSILVINLAFAEPTRVGNGNDGRDLENLKPVTDGPIVEGRKAAVALLKRMSVNGIPGLGNLIAEVENTKLYLAEKDVVDLENMGGFHTDMTGRVYARTFATANSATRFFPASLKISGDQMVALHIHEGLHRALPEEIREDEKIVAKMTLAIVSPESSYDNIKSVAASIMPEPETPATIGPAKVKISEKSRLHFPSTFSLDGKAYLNPKESTTKSTSLPISQIYTLSSHLYPFGGSNDQAFGIGIDYSFIKSDNESFSGPLGLSARMLLFTAKGFDFEGFAIGSLNSLSNEEVQNSFLGRDILTVGMTMRKAIKNIYFENDISYTLPSKAEQTVGNVDYNYEFGDVLMARVKVGGYYKNFHLGGFGEIYLAETTKVDGGGFSQDLNDRYRIVAFGPEIEWRSKNFGVRLFGRFMLDATEDVDFDQLGNMMGVGAGQGFIGMGISLSI